jgi:hypothetical protein
VALNPAKLKEKFGHCFWCQRDLEITEDHVPPKTAFPKRVWSSLPWVPACDGCNSAWKKDAEYFRDYLLTGPLKDCRDPLLKIIKEKYERARASRVSLGMKKSVFQTDVKVVTRGVTDRVYREQQVDLNRIRDVVMRTFSSVYVRHETRRAYYEKPMNQEIITLAADGYQLLVGEISSTNPAYARALDILATHGSADYGDGLLKWWCWEFPDDRKQKELLISLYDTAVFFGRVAKLDDNAPYCNVLERTMLKADPSKPPNKNFLEIDPKHLRWRCAEHYVPRI